MVSSAPAEVGGARKGCCGLGSGPAFCPASLGLGTLVMGGLGTTSESRLPGQGQQSPLNLARQTAHTPSHATASQPGTWPSPSLLSPIPYHLPWMGLLVPWLGLGP